MEPTVAEKLRACAKGEMKSIGFESTGIMTEDLNVVFNEGKSTFLYQSIYAVADAIEKEESEMRGFCKRLEKAVQDGEEVDLFGKAYVALPVDADGKPVRVGDMLYGEFCPSENQFKVAEISYCNGWIVRDDEKVSYNLEYYHHGPKAVEEILREFIHEFNRDDSEMCDEEIVEKYASMLEPKQV